MSSTWSDKDKAEIKLGLMYLKQCRLKTARTRLQTVIGAGATATSMKKQHQERSL